MCGIKQQTQTTWAHVVGASQAKLVTCSYQSSCMDNLTQTCRLYWITIMNDKQGYSMSILYLQAKSSRQGVSRIILHCTWRLAFYLTCLEMCSLMVFSLSSKPFLFAMLSSFSSLRFFCSIKKRSRSSLCSDITSDFWEWDQFNTPTLLAKYIAIEVRTSNCLFWVLTQMCTGACLIGFYCNFDHPQQYQTMLLPVKTVN